MFQMIDENNATREERKRIFWYKVGLFLAASAAVAGAAIAIITQIKIIIFSFSMAFHLAAA